MAGRKPTVSDEEILHVLSESDDPFLTTTEVAEQVDLSQPGMLKRLRDLEDAGYIDNKKAGNSNTWWITDIGRQIYDEEGEKNK
ncbi:winged helix-turn-helix domain-containing protein [Haloplanus rubicundus]|uniref:ArsR family transcriptional regulator n=1 Tax=Haloplanus rubicundus TaxID=1547898 RepID=A0A345EHC0_9EURY|nr:winged helix-turn-helix domain-containing protein [Haloplanus rubicundus]AXG11592.1 ArsR family transcriptional regulator [Haloplanus rubicundus]